MASKEKIDELVKKYDLKNKSIDELQRLIGDSDRDCLSSYEADMLFGETFIDKANKLYNLLHKDI